MPALKRIGAAALSAFGFGQGGGATTVTANFLVVAGGGGGGTYASAGGGGAGGYRTSAGTSGGGGSAESAISLDTTLSYTVLVGAGGVGKTGGTGAGGTNGSDSSISGTGLTTITSTGGGVGASANPTNPGGNGGSGGGGAANGQAYGTGTANQGYDGGTAVYSTANYPGGGGGGAGAVGQAAQSSSVAGNGGVGVASTISGTSTYYAGGGGGSVQQSGGTPGSGGNGGGGAGGNQVFGTAGSANTGGGAGASAGVSANGPNGGSGIVIISYTGAQQFGGGVVTTAAGNTIHTFYTSGVLSPINALSASYLVVAGGAGGGGGISFTANGGGGGAGGMQTGSALTIDTNSTYVVTVGAGGSAGGAGASGTSGANSSFSAYANASVGGGYGSGYNLTAANGGSGGGAGGSTGTYGSGISGQGTNGGASISGAAGGGGGAGQAGTGITPQGGNGSVSSISGTATYYAGGGGGGNDFNTTTPALGGGGTGAKYSDASGGGAGTVNTGGGGGGGASRTATEPGGNGGSGIVVIAYAGSTQQMSGGTVTVSGGNVIHTFTSSGYLSPLTNFSNSLRFRSSASAYLNRTPTVASDRQKWTWSGWVKRGVLSSGEPTLFSTVNGSERFSLTFSPDAIYTYWYNGSSYPLDLYTSAVFRDPAAWYHVVLSIDTTQATAANRVRLYVNGTQVTAFGTAVYPSQNASLPINTAVQHDIGRRASFADRYFDGYMTNINFIDGQALTPNSFGSYNQYGVWVPVTYGGSYGTNGFFLPFNSGYGVSTYAGGFNGTSQYLNVNYSPNWSTLGDFTMECWIYATAYSSSINTVGGTSHAQNDGYSMLYYYNTGRLAWGINGTNEFASTTGIINLNVWQHVAVVRSGSNMVMYVNGQNVASTSSASTYLSNNSATMYVGSTSTANQYFVGNMSNFRFVTSAVYTANFVPPVSPLTAISNTQLLTLQSSTVIDNSGNSRTITNNGTITTATATPFANPYTLTTDQSPQGNHWTPNNISLTTGSTYDSMTDVPTLSNATSSNYCVLNPISNIGNGTISSGNLNYVASSAAWMSAAGTIFPSTGKWYFEVTLVQFNSSFMLGVVNTSFVSWATYMGASAYGWALQGTSSGTGKWNNNSSATLAAGEVSATGNVFMVAYDVDAAKLWFGKSGTWYASGDPAAGTNAVYTNLSGSIAPAVSSSTTTDSLALNFGQQPFVYTPPSGFVALNAYNM